ncbi:MAG: DNA repair protein RadA, partial [Rhodospirillaceae bacterium]
MAKPVLHFVCRECGATHRRWQGKCDGCGAWNSIDEEPVTSGGETLPKGLSGGKGGRKLAVVSLLGEGQPPPRLPTGIGELDRVSGG